MASTKKDVKKKIPKLVSKDALKVEMGFLPHLETKPVKKLVEIMFPSAAHCTPALQEVMTWAGDLADGSVSLAVFKALLKKKQKKDVTEDQWLTGPEMEKLFNMLESNKEGSVHFASFYDSLKVSCYFTATLLRSHFFTPTNSVRSNYATL